MGDDVDNRNRKRNLELATLYSNMTFVEAERRLGFKLNTLNETPVAEMFGSGNPSKVFCDLVKNEVYEEIIRYIRVFGIPKDWDPTFNEISLLHLFYAVITPIIDTYIRETDGGDIRLQVGPQDGGTMGFVPVDVMLVKGKKPIFIVKPKRASMGQAVKQCLLLMKDARDLHGEDVVFGFITTGKGWWMLSYNGKSFKITEEMVVLFHSMGRDKERWMKDFSMLVDCMVLALDTTFI